MCIKSVCGRSGYMHVIVHARHGTCAVQLVHIGTTVTMLCADCLAFHSQPVSVLDYAQRCSLFNMTLECFVIFRPISLVYVGMHSSMMGLSVKRVSNSVLMISSLFVGWGRRGVKEMK